MVAEHLRGDRPRAHIGVSHASRHRERAHVRDGRHDRGTDAGERPAESRPRPVGLEADGREERSVRVRPPDDADEQDGGVEPVASHSLSEPLDGHVSAFEAAGAEARPAGTEEGDADERAGEGDGSHR